jgi:hypothetical protein
MSAHTSTRLPLGLAYLNDEFRIDLFGRYDQYAEQDAERRRSALTPVPPWPSLVFTLPTLSFVPSIRPPPFMPSTSPPSHLLYSELMEVPGLMDSLITRPCRHPLVAPSPLLCIVLPKVSVTSTAAYRLDIFIGTIAALGDVSITFPSQSRHPVIHRAPTESLLC